MRAKQFFYLSIGVLILVIAYGLTSERAIGQGASSIVTVTYLQGLGDVVAFSSTGDVYVASAGEFHPTGGNTNPPPHWWYRGNVFTSTVNVDAPSWGKVKREFRK